MTQVLMKPVGLSRVEIDVPGGDVPVATEDTAGIVKPDGETLQVDESGTISLKLANADTESF